MRFKSFSTARTSSFSVLLPCSYNDHTLGRVHLLPLLLLLPTALRLHNISCEADACVSLGRRPRNVQICRHPSFTFSSPTHPLLAREFRPALSQRIYTSTLEDPLLDPTKMSMVCLQAAKSIIRHLVTHSFRSLCPFTV